MRKRRIYIETSVPSFLAARPSRDLIKAAWQQITREWWGGSRSVFDLFVSQIVLDEAAIGDPKMAQRRLALLEGIPLLDPSEAAGELAATLTRRGAIPRKAATDALHIAIATVHEMDILLTWNCTHLANPVLLGGVNRVIRSTGREPPVICTPAEMIGD